MSFASDTKNELCRIEPQRCCRKAECYGLLLFGHSFSLQGVSLTTENLATARRAAQFAAEVAGAVMDVSAPQARKKDAVVCTVSAVGEEEARKVLACFGHTGHEINLHIGFANMENDCCQAAFLRGAFLSCGTVTSPEREYRLEFAVPYMNLANDLAGCIRDILELDLVPRVSRRKGAFVVYIKGGSRVADFLTFLGAPNAAMELMQVQMLKNLRNNVNRQTNFETANLEKTASAAAQEVLAIEKIQKHGMLDDLPEDLRELAELRLQNPDMSLRELGSQLSVPLSRSGVHHRLQRILAFAAKLR
ncbi:MAG: putative cell division protein WhiA [Thermocaproicibacter melissae]|jgi:cell division protein WhiA|uniref:DNA-binding protein WhiA n=1 Tax=Thermocaproicibacter melissae TaxID=2966552 RepID=UPI0024B27BE9|nr:DNA-binding protein WhiA [Thermocaproicibacter melissae]WBY64015.1 DNA-binding protein WhiA [Thermocaproicibacter melissae]